LHARRLGFVHPASGKPMMWKSQLPDDMADLIAILRSEAFEARAINEDEDDWDEDLEGGPEIIYARGDGEGDDEGDDEIDE
jgi:23S rRNA pseudouridine1911/1915/1917 synthase